MIKTRTSKKGKPLASKPQQLLTQAKKKGLIMMRSQALHEEPASVVGST